MQINLNDLPPRYRAQVQRQLCGGDRTVPVPCKSAEKTKYRSVKCEYNGIPFDSKKEMRRYIFLLDMLNMGVISDLRLQHVFTLQDAYTTASGERIRAITYKADFTYWCDGEFYVEDVKSEITKKKPDYRMKIKMMQDKLGIKVDEIEDVGIFLTKRRAF